MLRADVVLPNVGGLPGGEFAAGHELAPISGYACLIEYDGGPSRAIACRRYETKGGTGYVGAICQEARGYRLFRCDRIDAVYDLQTGEHLGAGEYFQRFASTQAKPNIDRWGLSSTRHYHLLAGLNILAFVAHCDGSWHPLEEEAIADFVTALWIQKGWDGDPPMDQIVRHAQRLAPDGSIFDAALRNFVRSSNSERILRRFIVRVIEADGRITDEEFEWSLRINEVIDEYAAAGF